MFFRIPGIFFSGFFSLYSCLFKFFSCLFKFLSRFLHFFGSLFLLPFLFQLGCFIRFLGSLIQILFGLCELLLRTGFSFLIFFLQFRNFAIGQLPRTICDLSRLLRLRIILRLFQGFFQVLLLLGNLFGGSFSGSLSILLLFRLLSDFLGGLGSLLGNFLGLFAHLLKLIGTLSFQSLLMPRTTSDVGAGLSHMIGHIQLLIGSFLTLRIPRGLLWVFSLGSISHLLGLLCRLFGSLLRVLGCLSFFRCVVGFLRSFTGLLGHVIKLLGGFLQRLRHLLHFPFTYLTFFLRCLHALLGRLLKFFLSCFQFLLSVSFTFLGINLNQWDLLLSHRLGCLRQPLCLVGLGVLFCLG